MRVPWPAVSYITRRREKEIREGKRRRRRRGGPYPDLELDVLAIEPQLSEFLQKIDCQSQEQPPRGKVQEVMEEEICCGRGRWRRTKSTPMVEM
jgi:hypothetical protein